ncbi:MAG: hypothetical protein ACYC0F_11005 [Rhodanobacter sp.]
MAMFFGISTAKAANGRIVFSGAVVESTCSTEDTLAAPEPRSGDESFRRRMNCGRTAADPGSSYSRVVTSLADADLAHDRLLGYFASYARVDGDGKATAKIIVHTYD